MFSMSFSTAGSCKKVTKNGAPGKIFVPSYFVTALEQIFLTVGRNNFCNKIPFFFLITGLPIWWIGWCKQWIKSTMSSTKFYHTGGHHLLKSDPVAFWNTWLKFFDIIQQLGFIIQWASECFEEEEKMLVNLLYFFLQNKDLIKKRWNLSNQNYHVKQVESCDSKG